MADVFPARNFTKCFSRTVSAAKYGLDLFFLFFLFVLLVVWLFSLRSLWEAYFLQGTSRIALRALFMFGKCGLDIRVILGWVCHFFFNGEDTPCKNLTECLSRPFMFSGSGVDHVALLGPLSSPAHFTLLHVSCTHCEEFLVLVNMPSTVGMFWWSRSLQSKWHVSTVYVSWVLLLLQRLRPLCFLVGATDSFRFTSNNLLQNSFSYSNPF